MEIRLATQREQDEIFGIIQDAQNYLKEQNIPQWQNGYPDLDTVMQDIASQCNFVLCDEAGIVGTCMISFDEDPYYKNIDGKWLSNERYAVIHRLAIKSAAKGQGIANQFFEFAQKVAKQQGINYIRIDTHEINKSMRKSIEKNGFTQCGIVHVKDHAPRIAYEKEINHEV